MLPDRVSSPVPLTYESGVLPIALCGPAVKELTNELKPFSRHIFIAMWQRKQYKNLISNIPQDNVALLMDFAENYRCINQDEIQAAYYQYQQATVFPHSRCDKCKNGIVTESAVSRYKTRQFYST